MSIPAGMLQGLVYSRQSEEWQEDLFCTETKSQIQSSEAYLSGLHLLNPILLIPPDSSLAIRHGVFFIGVLFNNMLIDGYHSIRIRGQSAFQMLEMLNQRCTANCSMLEIQVVMSCARLQCLYCSCLGSVQASL